jgi:mono/diheme cytochrome c family protein
MLKNKISTIGHLILIGLVIGGSSFLVQAEEAGAEVSDKVKADYKQHCAACHGVERLGIMGPALLPDNLKRLREKKAAVVIAEGRAATQMPAFKNVLDENQRKALVDYIFTQPKVTPTWEEKDILASQVVTHKQGQLPNKPVFEADLMNLFLVVEIGDHHVTVLNGDTFEPIHRFKTRFALHGGPKYSPDGRYVYFASRDGWITKYDIYNLKVVAEVRAGINTRNLAISSDGKSVIVANYLPYNLVMFDAENLDMLKVYPVANDAGKTSRVSAVYNAPPRNTFIAALKDLKEVWEIPYPVDKKPAAVRKIVVDDY